MMLYLGRRIFSVFPILFGVSIIVFLSVRLVPGDPALAVAGPDATAEDLARVRQRLGLDRPAHLQFTGWLGNVLRGDLGRSVANDYPVLQQLTVRSFRTLQLATLAMFLSAIIGIPLGITAALRPHSIVDYLTMSLGVVGISMPVFWLGLLLMYVFAVRMHLLPVAGADTPMHLILPCITLSPYSLALISHMTRASMLEVLSKDYIRTARAKGCPEYSVVAMHGLRSALIPILTVVGLQFGYLLSGAVVTETVFAWPGLGRLMADAVFLRDFPIIQGAVLLIATSFVIVNLLTDILVAFVDPRVRYE